MTVTNGITNSASNDVVRETVSITVDAIPLKISAIHRGLSDPVANALAPILFLHGFGSTKEDYADIAHHRAFAHRPFLAYDAPGCGATSSPNEPRLFAAISIPFLVRVAQALLARFGIARFHLVGHSMGGLTALLLAHACSATATAEDGDPRVLSFVDIEGNLAPEDCFLSRQIVSHATPTSSPEHFLSEFVERARVAPIRSSAFYAEGAARKVRAGAVRGIFESMVQLSDHGVPVSEERREDVGDASEGKRKTLMEVFLRLDCPRAFMYGEENRGLSYLRALREVERKEGGQRVRVLEVEGAGHWPMYANQAEMWRGIAAVVGMAEEGKR